jgi:hypothetical protein
MVESFLVSLSGAIRPLPLLPSGAVDQNRRKRAASGGGDRQREHGRGADKRGLQALRRTRPGHRETADEARLRLALEGDR